MKLSDWQYNGRVYFNQTIKIFSRRHLDKILWLPKGNRDIDLKFDIILIAQQTVEQYLDVGEYAFPFRFQVAQNISPSFKSFRARTQYSVVSTLDVDPYFNWYCFLWKLFNYWNFNKHIKDHMKRVLSLLMY